MTDNEIIKALECSAEWIEQHGRNTNTGIAVICRQALDLINRQQAEIEMFHTEKDNLIKTFGECQIDVIKEFAERLKDEASTVGVDEMYDGQPMYVSVETIDNLVKEMVGEAE